ncbi:restriction endonuclease subunit S [Paracoccus sp. TOH]|uniref:restriction endonuclease subunit S n=1 Tax=Paracoccus sp. TOH TaxID=1263728 RepID=UPI0025B1DC7D|nr:restriction endonuclease subunit S [Paracoccus sp. TOH]WJS85461.1 restriction endonuclease subunit S [Paracoccus sp. TOH]
MKSTEAKGPAPRLRFPEFHDAGPWEVKRLGDVYRFKPTNSWPRDRLNYEAGSVRNIHYGDIHKGLNSTFRLGEEAVPFLHDELAVKRAEDAYCEPGDIVFADASEDIVDVGRAIEIIDTDGEKLVAGLHTILARQIERRLISGFGAYLFASSGIRTQIQERAQGAKVLGISKSQLAEVKLAYPKDEREQQKIADCLSSLDELIRAEGERLAALKDYKTALMQRLFPAPGETIPRLRFSEFRDAGAWKAARLGDKGIVQFIRERVGREHIPLGHYVSTVNLLPDFGGLSATPEPPPLASAVAYREGDILVSNIRPYLRKVWIADRIGGASNDVLVARPGDSIVRTFLGHLLMSDRFIAHVMDGAKGVKMPRGDLDHIRDFEIPCPTKLEQQKIAGCLTSLDELIRAQNKKIKALKAHKRGLMQQLFPQEAG